MSLPLVIDVLGWTGAGLLLYAYARVSAGKWSGQSRIFQYFNIAGSVFFILNSGYHGAYPSMFVNIIWAGIGVGMLLKSAGSAV